MTRRLSVCLAMLVTVTALLVASPLAGPSTETTKGGTLRVSSFADLDLVDPALVYDPWSWEIGYATCAKLFNYPDAAGVAGTRVVPEVVDRFKVSEDGRTYTFALRQTFRFHTGAAVTAQSFADAFNRVAHPRMKSPATAYMGEIAGASAVIDGKATSVAGVRVLGRYRLQLRLTERVGDLTARLTMPFFCPVLPDTPIDPAGIDSPAGSGPYYVAERIVNQRIVLKRNPYYRGSRPSSVDQIVWMIGEPPDACVTSAEADRIDRCAIVPPASHRAFAAKYGINKAEGQYFGRPGMSTEYVAFNHARPAFRGAGQIPLEKAINYALDRHALARAFGYVEGKRTDRMLPPALGRPGHDYPIAGADVVTARKWLARAGLKPKELVLYTTNTSFGVGVAQVFTSNMRQLDIEVEVKYLDFPALWEKAGTTGEPFDVVFVGWTTDYADPAGYFVPLLHGASLRPTGNLNRSYLDDPTVNRRIDAANRLTGAAPLPTSTPT
jgi:peptide/nickel transport system substrate-binding protein